MRKFLTTLTLSLGLVSASSWAAQPVVINVDDASPPFSYKAGGNVIGVYPAIFYAAFARMKVPLKINAKPWVQALAEADTGKVAIGNIYSTPERQAKYDFSEPVVVENIAVYFNKKKPIAFKSASDLYGKKVGSVSARFYGDDFEAGKKSGGITVIEGRSDKANLLQLSTGGLDAVLAPEDSARGIIAVKRLDNIDMSHAYLISNVGHLAFVKTAKQTDLLDRFNKTIAAMKQDGTLAKIVKEELSRSNF